MIPSPYEVECGARADPFDTASRPLSSGWVEKLIPAFREGSEKVPRVPRPSSPGAAVLVYTRQEISEL